MEEAGRGRERQREERGLKGLRHLLVVTTHANVRVYIIHGGDLFMATMYRSMQEIEGAAFCSDELTSESAFAAAAAAAAVALWRLPSLRRFLASLSPRGHAPSP